ncbi:tyrosine-protein phosphatase non-receptor type 20 [Molossus nigricans]
MSLPRKASEPGTEKEEEDSDTTDWNSWKTLPSSSQGKTPRTVTAEVFANEVNLEKVKLYRQDFQHIDSEDLLKGATESFQAFANVSGVPKAPSYLSGSEPSMRTASGAVLRDKWSSESELAGPSQTPGLHGVQIVSERELAQLTQVRPLVFGFHEQSAIKDCLKILQKKVEEHEIIQEFMALEHMDLPAEYSSGNEPWNRDKNRYRDILPYDSTRVPLGENNDYINASYIRVINSGQEYFYIATQGPLPGTTDDFWQMVLENNSNVIIMITRESEGGTVKCHHYWPMSLKKPLELKSCRIFLENYQILQHFIVRVLRVVTKSTGAAHWVKHLQFTNWPDHGTPAPLEGFIEYVRFVRKCHRTGPVIVHCSAGVGRTGVFICVDVVFCAIEKNFSFNIKNIVAQMREQRCGMVQTKEQYCFCYTVVLAVLQKLVTLD